MVFDQLILLLLSSSAFTGSAAVGFCDDTGVVSCNDGSASSCFAGALSGFCLLK